MIEFIVEKNNSKFVILNFELSSGIITPEELKMLELPDLVKQGLSNKLLIISGRGPIWLYCYLTHFYHTSKAIAIFDPRLNGAVIVQSHDPLYKEGDIVKEIW